MPRRGRAHVESVLLTVADLCLIPTKAGRHGEHMRERDPVLLRFCGEDVPELREQCRDGLIGSVDQVPRRSGADKKRHHAFGARSQHVRLIDARAPARIGFKDEDSVARHEDRVHPTGSIPPQKLV